MHKSLKIFSLNVRGLADKVKRQDVLNLLKGKRMQIYCLVDIHISPENHLAFTHDGGYESRGDAVLFSDFEYEILDIDKDDIGNFLFLKICENIPLILCGDWNLVQNFTTDTYGYIGENNTKAKQKVPRNATCIGTRRYLDSE